MESEPPFDAKVWARLGSELGVLGLSVPEDDGGVGGTLVDQAVAIEELGASLACGPVFGTVFLAIPALVAASAGQARDELLADLVEGRRTAAFAVPDDAGVLGDVLVTADGEALTGTVERVVDAGAADELLVAARHGEGLALYAVDASAAEVARRSLATLDLTRPQATVELSGAPGRLVAGGDQAERVIGHALHVGSALLAVEQVGAAQHLLDLSVDYAKSRLQFGRPIGSFQAISHKFAELATEIAQVRLLVRWVASLTDEDPRRMLPQEASMAKLAATELAKRCALEGVQIMGGYGYALEYPMERNLRAAVVTTVYGGTSEIQKNIIAKTLGL
jgi:alkylation response protein AidB-like acyl-CoA dehydrogenase